MGNSMSEEEENAFLEEAYRMSLDSPDVDRQVNMGTTAPNCQPKHTIQMEQEEAERRAAEEAAANDDDDDDDDDDDVGLEVVMSGDKGDKPEFQLPDDGSSAPLSPNKSKARRASSVSSSTSGGGGSRHGNKAATGQAASRRKRADRKNTPDTERERQKKLSYFQMARLGYQEMVNAIIRPPRADYKMEALGPPAFTFCGRRFTRTDFTLRTKRGLNLECSHWEPVERTSDRIPVVIYMHGNSSARVEVIPQLSYLLSLGLAVFAFDFAGSGKSDGEYVSLGYYEREDLMCVIAHLRATNVVSTIALWGRSMGAATALMHGDRDPSIACMILDSSFADLTQLAEEMVEKGREQGITVPNFVVSVAIRMIQSSVKKQAYFNIRHISPIAHADKSFIPALFVAGEHDDFIHKRHSEAIHARYAGDKNLIIVEGDHNSPRPKFMFDSASIFLQTCLQIPSSWALKVHPGMNLMAPPWYFPGVGTSYANTGAFPGITSPPRASNRRDTASSSSSSMNGTGGGGHAAKRGNSSSQSGMVADRNGDEMGMTLERQREIQASLFKMLGQADDGNSGTKATTSKRDASSANGDSKQKSSVGATSRDRTSSVNHSSTFPPPSRDEDLDRHGEDEERVGAQNRQNSTSSSEVRSS